MQIRTGLHKDFTRLVLETPEPVPYKFAFPAADEIVITVTGAVQPDRKAPPATGIIRAIKVNANARGSRLVIKTKARADIQRQFTILPRGGKGARIVIDLAAAPIQPSAEPAAAAPRIDLPAPHTTITGDSIPAPAPLPRQAAATPKPRSRPTEPFEVAGAGQLSMLFDRATPAEQSAPLELAQAGGISVGDWLRQEGGNPNVRALPPAPRSTTDQPPAPSAYPAQPVYRAPMTNRTPNAVPARGSAAYPAASGRPPQYRAPANQAPAYQPYGAYPTEGRRPAAPTHPSHPGYGRPPASGATAPAYQQQSPRQQSPRQQAPQRQAGTSAGTAQDTSPAARYASQKQTIAVDTQAADGPLPFYAGFGLGFSYFDYESENRNTTVEEDVIVWKLNAGYRFNDVLAAELSYGKVGGVDETYPNSQSSESLFYAFSASTLFYLPLNPRIRPFGRLGLSLWHEDGDESAGVTPRTEDSGVGMVMGLGLDYRLTPNFDVRGEWELNLLTDDLITNNITASVLYRF